MLIRKYIFIGLSLGLLFVQLGCNKEKRSAHMTVKMVDGPGDYQEVNVEVLRIEVKHEKDGWLELATNQGVYD
ncbi:MAG: DUF4382 domain-containing protein, partial [Bacteroidetes bacterium]|nr:DUF4382 domain-containing protein [Bacteroidota bacterium]